MQKIEESGNLVLYFRDTTQNLPAPAGPSTTSTYNSYELLKAIFENSPVQMAFFDPQLYLRACNESYLRAVKIATNHSITLGAHLLDYALKQDLEMLKEATEKALSGEKFSKISDKKCLTKTRVSVCAALFQPC